MRVPGWLISPAKVLPIKSVTLSMPGAPTTPSAPTETSMTPMTTRSESAVSGRGMCSPMVRMVQSRSPISSPGITLARSLSNTVSTSRPSSAKYPSSIAAGTGANPNQ